MKKLIVVAAVACTAMFANAASLDWKVVTGAGSTGLNIYICASIAEFESASDISNYLLGSDGNTAAAKSNGRGAAAWLGNAGTVGGIDDSQEGSGKSFYAVVVSSDGKGYWTMAGTGEIYTTSTEPTVGSLDMTSKLATAYTPWKGGSTDVPEPTSGLLLVLGGAMLALRRRRA